MPVQLKAVLQSPLQGNSPTNHISFILVPFFIVLRYNVSMCFSVPKRVVRVYQDKAIVQGGAKVRLGSIRVQKGDFLLVYGDMAVEKVSTQKVEQFRKMIGTTI
jgi:hydrogenase maturation factor